MGVDAINPVQLSARGMDPAYFKKEFGKNLTFWGGGIGGYVFATVNNIQADVPAENILVMFESYAELR